LAAYWFCENKERGVIEGKDEENEDDIRYITYRWWNFLIDDPERRDYAGRELFGGRADLMKNYFGDIHILALEDIEPDLERTGFRHTDAYKQFKNAITDRDNPGDIKLLYNAAFTGSKIQSTMREVVKAEEILDEIDKAKSTNDTEELYKRKFKTEEQKKKIMKKKKGIDKKLTTPEKQKAEKTIKKLEKKEKEIEKHIVESQKDRAKPKKSHFDTKTEIKIEPLLRILKKHLKNHATLYNAIIKDLEALVRGK
jgi:hypothetical protein